MSSEWNKANPDRVAAARRRYNERNAEKVREQSRLRANRYYHAHKEELKAKREEQKLEPEVAD